MDMPTLSEAVGTALDELYAPAASTGTPPDATAAPASTSDSGAPPPDDSSSTPTPDAEKQTPTPDASDNQAAPPPTSAAAPEAGTKGELDASSKALIDQAIADFPDLAPALTAKVKELERGYQKKFEALAVARKEMEAAVANGHLAQQIPESDLQGMVQLHRLAQSNPALAADYLFQASESLRQQAGSAPQQGGTPDLAALQQTPEWQAMRQYNQQQQLQQIQQALETQYAGLQTEFGGQPIPANQREEVEQECMKLGLGLEAIPMVWRSTYGVEYARQEALKRGQLIKQGKQGLSVSSSGAPAPDPGGSPKPQTMHDALGAVLDQYQVR